MCSLCRIKYIPKRFPLAHFWFVSVLVAIVVGGVAYPASHFSIITLFACMPWIMMNNRHQLLFTKRILHIFYHVHFAAIPRLLCCIVCAVEALPSQCSTEMSCTKSNLINNTVERFWNWIQKSTRIILLSFRSPSLFSSTHFVLYTVRCSCEGIAAKTKQIFVITQIRPNRQWGLTLIVNDTYLS